METFTHHKPLIGTTTHNQSKPTCKFFKLKLPPRQDARASENPSHCQKTTFKGRTPFNIGRPLQIKPMTTSRPQSTGILQTNRRPQNNNRPLLNKPQSNSRPPKNHIPTPAQAGDMSTIFMNTMKQLSHDAQTITELEKYFRQSSSGNTTEEEQW